MDDLVQRLQRFEEYMKDERQDYPAELLHRTIDRIEQLEANERAWLATNEDLQQACQQAADRIERLEAALRKLLDASDQYDREFGRSLGVLEDDSAWYQDDAAIQYGDAKRGARRALDGEDE